MGNNKVNLKNYYKFKKTYNLTSHIDKLKTNFNSIDKNDVIQYYITDNHTRKKSAKYFNLSEDQFRMQLKNNKIKKDQKLASDNSHKKYKIFISNISPEEVQLALDNGLTNNKI